MKILILGKNGQVGSSLLLKAKSLGISCISTGHEQLDISNKNEIDVFFGENHDIDFVINAAAYTNVDGAEKEQDIANAVNYLAVKYLAEACKKYDIPIIHLSTDYVFDGQKSTGYSEDDLSNPVNVYGKTKLDGERALKEIGMKHIILRVSWVFSEYGKNFLKTISDLSEKKEVISVVCDQFGSPTSAHSIADVILTICSQLHKNRSLETCWGIYHYTDFPVTNWHQFATYIANSKENKKILKKIIPIESKDYPTAAKRPKNSILNVEKIKHVFGINQKLWTTEVEKIMRKETVTYE